MADYISREAAIAIAEHAYNEWNLAMGAADGQRQINRCFKMQELCKAVASVFADSPAADVEPVRHGRWVNMGGFPACSKCGCSPGFYEPDPNNPQGFPGWCYGCGAKMDLEGEK